LCPECTCSGSHGKLGHEDPKVLVKLKGSPLITGTKYTAECLRCNFCSARFQADWPVDVASKPKYDVSCASALAIGRYSMGLPLHRIEFHQAMHGIPMADATQWDLLNCLYTVVAPVHDALIEEGANGELVIYDDTPGRVLENQAKGLATHTTAFISVRNENKIHLFFTGQNHAGNNAGNILEKRTNDEPVIAMMDASPNNIPKQMSVDLTARFILCFCLTHGRRKFFEMLGFFEEHCDFVLEVIGMVYQHDAHCKKEKYTPEQRLAYHQKHSQPLMESLYRWLNNQLLYDQIEANAGLGQAVSYMLRHWSPLTTFLHVAGAPLDSSWAERAIKVAIRHRRNSLFYKTPKGALVGDGLMSIIYTAQQNGVNPFDYLNELQRHADQVAANPFRWLPWNYRQNLAEKPVPLAQVA
jgi:transposase